MDNVEDSNMEPAVEGSNDFDSERSTATVNTINVSRGFGFLKLSNGKELFFHSNQVRNCEDIRLLREGDSVDFTIGPDAKNPDKQEAKDVTVNVDVSSRTKLVDTHSRRRSRSPRGRERDYDYYRPEPRRVSRDPYYDDPYYARRDPRDFEPYHRDLGRDYRDGPRDYYARRSPDPYRRSRSGYDYDMRREPIYEPRRSRTPPREQGLVKTVVSGRGYGFIEIQGKDYFFPAKQVVNATFDELTEGEQISCIIVRDPRDPDKWQAQRLRRQIEQGTIESLKKNFGYIQNDFGEKVFFHGRHIEAEFTFDDIEEGMRVEYKTVQSHSHKGKMEAQQITVLSSEEETKDQEDEETAA